MSVAPAVLSAASGFITYDHWLWAVTLLLLLDWIFFQPVLRVGFGSSEGDGQARSGTVALAALNVAWLACILGVATGGPIIRLAAALGLSIGFRHFFIALRWRSVRRGSGAPGFMAHWTARAIFLIEAARCLDQSVVETVLLALRWDFGWIILCAGTYKALSGYLSSNGMEYGRVNPIWGYHWRVFSQLSPTGWYPRLMNWLASGVEIVSGLLMILPTPLTQMLGAAAISLSFLYVACFIRLGRLAILMVVLPFLLWPQLYESAAAALAAFSVGLPWTAILIKTTLWVYIGLLPVVKVMQYLNLFRNIVFPEPAQRWLSAYANWVPIIVWRVFTADLTDFFCYVHGCDRDGRPIESMVDASTYSLGNWRRWRFKLRMLHVTESIAITSVFTTLKYFPSKPDLFADKLWRYSQSLLADYGRPFPVLRYEFFKIEKRDTRFSFDKMGDFVIDCETGVVRREHVVAGFDFAKPADQSPVREGAAPGAMTPLSR